MLSYEYIHYLLSVKALSNQDINYLSMILKTDYFQLWFPIQNSLS